MSEHLTDEQIAGYRQRSLSGADRLAFSRHLARCDECRERVAAAVDLAGRRSRAYQSLQADLRAEAEMPTHLPEEQLAAYVNEELDEIDREIVESHLDLCPHCTGLVEELRSFRTFMSSYPAKEHGPAPRSSWWTRLTALGSFTWAPLQVATMAAAMVVAALGGVFWADSRDRELPGPLLSPSLTIAEHVEEATAGMEQRHQEEITKLRKERDALRQQMARASTLEAERDRLQRQAARVSALEGKLQAAQARLRQSALQAAQVRMALQSWDPASRLALKTGKLPVAPDLKELKGKPIKLAGPEGESKFSVLAPQGQVIRSARPTFSWRPLAGATHYQVEVFDGEESLAATTPSEGVKAPLWQPARPLARGQVYQWRVKAWQGEEELARAPEPPDPFARFRVLDQATEDELERASGSPFRMGVLHTQAGMPEEAERAFQQAAKANPDIPVIRELLKQVRNRRSP